MAVVLDHPFLPKSDLEEVSVRWSNTVSNTRKMFESLEEFDTVLASP